MEFVYKILPVVSAPVLYSCVYLITRSYNNILPGQSLRLIYREVKLRLSVLDLKLQPKLLQSIKAICFTKVPFICKTLGSWVLHKNTISWWNYSHVRVVLENLSILRLTVYLYWLMCLLVYVMSYNS